MPQLTIWIKLPRMNKWLLGALNSGLKKAVDLGLVILTAFTVGGHIDIQTLIYTTSIGFITGIFFWVSSNPLPPVAEFEIPIRYITPQNNVPQPPAPGVKNFTTIVTPDTTNTTENK